MVHRVNGSEHTTVTPWVLSQNYVAVRPNTATARDSGTVVGIHNECTSKRIVGSHVTIHERHTRSDVDIVARN